MPYKGFNLHGLNFFIYLYILVVGELNKIEYLFLYLKSRSVEYNIWEYNSQIGV